MLFLQFCVEFFAGYYIVHSVQDDFVVLFEYKKSGISHSLTLHVLVMLNFASQKNRVSREMCSLSFSSFILVLSLAQNMNIC